MDTPFIREQSKKHGREVVAWSNGVASNYQTPIVISGPSGVGKGTLISKLMKEFPSKFGFSVSHTTRAPREKEQNGVHYHFTERSIMEEEIRSGKFLEFASVHGNLYGTSIDAVEVVADAGKVKKRKKALIFGYKRTMESYMSYVMTSLNKTNLCKKGANFESGFM